MAAMSPEIRVLVEALKVADDNIFCDCIVNFPEPDTICDPHRVVRDALRTQGVHIPPLEDEATATNGVE